jgi:hypothetical protein
MERRDVASLLWLAAGQRALAVTEFHPRLLQLTERMRELEAKPPHRLYYNPSKFLPGDLDRTRAQLLKMSPQLAKLAKSATSGPWEKVELLAEPKAFAPANTFMVATRHERHVFLVAGGVASPTDKSPNKQAAAKPYLQLVRASLDGAPPQALGKAFIAIKDFDAKFAAVVLPSCVTQCVIHGDHLYAGTLTDGIYAFPLAGGDAVRIGDKEGLPALDVVALSAVDNKLVAILRGGYIVVYDLAARQCDVIVSSRRAQKVSPFDNAKTLAVAHIIPDPERRRVLFPILQESLEHPNTGTWAYDLKARSFHKLLPTASFRPSSVQDGAFALEAFDWLGRFDLVHDKLTLLRGKGPGGIVPQTPSGLDPKFSAAFPGRLFHGGGTIARLYHAGYVWTGSIFAGSPLREAGTNSCNTCYGQPEEIVPSTSSKPLAPMKCC